MTLRPTTTRILASLALTIVTAEVWPSLSQAAAYDKLCPNPGTPQPSANEIRQLLQERKLEQAQATKDGASLAPIRMCNLNLGGGDFRNLDFPDEVINVNFSGALLDGSSIGNAPGANFSRASLRNVQFEGRYDGAIFNRADLRGATFLFSSLNGASLILTKIDGTYFNASFKGATFVPDGIPAEGSGMGNLASIHYPEQARPSVERLRDYYRNAGLRDAERQLTHAIEANTTAFLFSRRSPSGRLEAVFRFIVFDLPTAYGLYPGRALVLIIVAWLALIPVYKRAIAARPVGRGPAGIYLKLPAGRLVRRNGMTRLAANPIAVRLDCQGRSAWKWAAYFSLLSAFHVGFRDFNVGSWIEQAQKRDFRLEAVGGPRQIAGFQSLLSLFLLATWVLTYFGRPFQ
jgi:Pentapeptide repeats (8 copies)